MRGGASNKVRCADGYGDGILALVIPRKVLWLPKWCSACQREVVGCAPAVSSGRQGLERVQRRPRPPPRPRVNSIDVSRIA